MKRTEWNKIMVTCNEAADDGNGGTEWFLTRKAVGMRTLRRRQANLNIGVLHDAVWEGY